MPDRAKLYAPTESRRAQIIDATIQVLAQEGYSGTSFARIREQAKLSSTRLISYHFASRDALMAAVVEQVVAGAAEVMRPAMEAETSYRGKLAAYIRSNLTYLGQESSAAVAVTEIARNGVTPGKRDGEDLSAVLLAVLLTQGQEAGEFEAFEPATTAHAIRAVIDSVAARLRPDALIDPAQIEDIVALLDRATTYSPKRKTS